MIIYKKWAYDSGDYDELIPKGYRAYIDDDGHGFEIRHHNWPEVTGHFPHVFSGSILCFDTVLKKLTVRDKMPKCTKCNDTGTIYYEAMGEQCSSTCTACDAHKTREIEHCENKIKHYQSKLKSLRDSPKTMHLGKVITPVFFAGEGNIVTEVYLAEEVESEAKRLGLEIK